MTQVSLTNIVKDYGRTRVIHGVDLTINTGEFVVFVGPSGCGKSTLLRMIAGLEDITGGDLAIGDEIVNDVVPAERGVAMVFQSYALYPHMTVFENMAFGLKQAKTPRDEIHRRVRGAGEALQLTSYLDRLPKHLSGGQRQRVAIGRAIVRDPKVFLAQLFAGQLVVSNEPEPLDPSHFGRWHADYCDADLNLIDVARMELQLRLRRQSIAGWHSGISRPLEIVPSGARTAARVQSMIRFIAENYKHPITVADVAAAAGVSKGHAMSLFQKTLETSINSYLTNLRLHHARTMLVNGDDKILNIALDSGFGSVSRFYEIFVRDTGITPRAYRRSL